MQRRWELNGPCLERTIADISQYEKGEKMQNNEELSREQQKVVQVGGRSFFLQKCVRCGHEWLARQAAPRACARCRCRNFWAEPQPKPEPKPKGTANLYNFDQIEIGQTVLKPWGDPSYNRRQALALGQYRRRSGREFRVWGTGAGLHILRTK